MSVERFIEPQKEWFQKAYSEIKNGGKDTHWMWFIFPQAKGLGTSGISQYYGITSLSEAKEFLKDSYLGNNLRLITEALLERKEDVRDIFGYPDYLKLKSSMTLFHLASETSEPTIFSKVLDQFYNGQRCERTSAILKGEYTLEYMQNHPQK